MKLTTLILVALLCAGCSTWNPETRIEETSFLTLHAVDGFQTAAIAHTPGTYEAESAWAMGREPTAGRTAAYFAAVALIHFAVTDYMCSHHAPEWLIRTWELGGIAWDVRDVTHNYEIGLGPFKVHN